MTPRITFLIIIGIVVYVTLSFYHRGQIKKIPSPNKPNPVRSVLKRDGQEKNWVQITTSPEHPAVKNSEDPAPTSPATDAESEPAQPETAVEAAVNGAQSIASEHEKVKSPVHTETGGEAKSELSANLNKEKEPARQQTVEIRNLQEQLASLRSSLDETSARLREKSIALERSKKHRPTATDMQGNKDTSNEQIQRLKSSLAAKHDALVEANKRIAGLSELLDQSRNSLVEAEDTSTHLQRLLSETEYEKIEALQVADRIRNELESTREERETYLAETGRLNVQLQEARTKTAYLANELDKARLKSEAMLRYGQEQAKLITPFRQQIELLNARLADNNSTLLKAEEQIDELREELKTSQDTAIQLQLEQQKNAAIEEEIKNISQALDTKREQSDKLTLQLKVLGEQLNTRDTNIETLSRELAQARSDSQAAAQQADALSRERDQHTKELDIASRKIAELDQQLKNAASRSQDMENSLNETLTANRRLAEKITEQNELLTKTGTEIDQLTAQVQAKEQLLADAEKELLTSREALQQLENANSLVDEANKARAGAEATITGLQETLGTTESRLARADAEIQSLQQALQETLKKQQDAPADTALRQEVDHLTNTLADSDKKYAGLEQAADKLKKENTLLLQKINEAGQRDSITAELQSELERRAEELGAMQKRLDALENSSTELRSELDGRNTAFFKMQEEYNSLQNKFISLQKERDELFPYSVDSDNDTVSDALDNCPETFPGAQVNSDGCEMDTDGDQVVDRLDLCPDSQEAAGINPFGCKPGTPIVLSGIFFSGGSADLSPAARSYLNKVAEALKVSESTRFEIGGHTDSTGEAARNLTISKQRAEAVRKYLVENGIDAGRLNAIGYGSLQPVAENTTLEGLAANRRVELKIIANDDAPATTGENKTTGAAETEDLPAR